MKKKQTKGGPFVKGHDPRRTLNSPGRPKGKTLLEALKKHARESGQLERVAAAMHQGLETGFLPLKVPDVGKHAEHGGYYLEFADWWKMLTYIWPAAKAATEAEDVEEIKRRIEVKLGGVASG